jgi:predicted nuclease with TOPRIM domain
MKDKKTMVDIHTGEGRLVFTMYENIIARRDKDIATLQEEIKRLHKENDRLEEKLSLLAIRDAFNQREIQQLKHKKL